MVMAWLKSKLAGLSIVCIVENICSKTTLLQHWNLSSQQRTMC